MSKDHYIPPEQSLLGQIFDSLTLVTLILSLILGPLVFGAEPERTIDQTISAQNWQTLKQNEAMASAWERLDYTPKTAEPLIAKRFVYEIDVWMLVAAIVVMIVYYLILVFISRSEYRDVISERYDDDQPS